jgi:hypothetical protein
VIAGIGHFPMSENPALFRQHILPVLDEIRQESPSDPGAFGRRGKTK